MSGNLQYTPKAAHETWGVLINKKDFPYPFEGYYVVLTSDFYVKVVSLNTTLDSLGPVYSLYNQGSRWLLWLMEMNTGRDWLSTDAPPL